MKKENKKILEYPFLVSICMIIISVAFTFLPVPPLLSGLLGEQEAGYLVGFLEQTAVAVVLVFLIRWLGLQKLAGLQRQEKVDGAGKGRGKQLWLLWPMFLFCLLNITDFLDGEFVIDASKPLRIVLFVLVYFSTGLFEEVLCRGFVFSVMINKWGKTRRGCYGAMLLSSLLFGLVHLVHFFLGHASLLATVAQVVYAFFIGVFFCASLVRNKSIYPVILLHALINITGDLDELGVDFTINKAYRTMTLEEAVGCVLLVLPFFLYGLFLVRKERSLERLKINY